MDVKLHDIWVWRSVRLQRCLSGLYLNLIKSFGDKISSMCLRSYDISRTTRLQILASFATFTHCPRCYGVYAPSGLPHNELNKTPAWWMNNGGRSELSSLPSGDSDAGAGAGHRRRVSDLGPGSAAPGSSDARHIRPCWRRRAGLHGYHAAAASHPDPAVPLACWPGRDGDSRGRPRCSKGPLRGLQRCDASDSSHVYPAVTLIRRLFSCDVIWSVSSCGVFLRLFSCDFYPTLPTNCAF